MLKIDVDEIARMLKQESERNGGTLSKFDNIAWHAYLSSLPGAVLDHVDYEKVQQNFPNFEDDPDANDPVLAMSCGKHYFDPDPNIPDGECIDETEFEGLSRQIRQDAKHLGGKLTMPFIVAWTGKLLALHQCQEITDYEYAQLLRIIPEVPDNPVKSVEEFMSRYIKVSS